MTTLLVATAVPDTSAMELQSVWHFMLKGGWMMIPIGICSLVALTVTVERLIVLRRKNIVPDGVIDDLGAILEKDGDGAIDRAVEHCQKNASPIANICAAGLRKIHAGEEAVEKQITSAGQWEIFKLRKYLRVLSVIAAVTPLMGLVGTIFGMIKAFQTVAVSGEALGRTELLAEGIYEAMITTAAGLIVAIPALILYHYLSSRIERIVAEMDRVCIEFVERFAQQVHASAPLPTVERKPVPHPDANTAPAPVAVGASE